MGGNGCLVEVWLLLGIALAHHPHRTEWSVARSSLRPGSSAAGLIGGPAAGAGRRSSMSISLSAASDPFASTGRSSVGRPLVQLAMSSGRGQPRRAGHGGPKKGRLSSSLRSRGLSQPAIGGSGRGPGYLVIPASALIRFLASRSSGGGFPATYPGIIGLHDVGVQQGLGDRVSGAEVSYPGQSLGGLSLNGISIVSLGQPGSTNLLPNALGIANNGEVTGAAPGPGGVIFLGGQRLAGAQSASNLPLVAPGSIPSLNMLSNQASVSQTPLTSGNSANNIIIQDQTSPSGQKSGGLVIGGQGGTITIKGSLLTGVGAPRIEQEEIETEESQKNNNGVSAQNATAGDKTIILDSGSGKSQTIVIGGGGGTFTIGDKTAAGVQIPGNTTFILTAGTTPRVDV